MTLTIIRLRKRELLSRCKGNLNKRGYGSFKREMWYIDHIIETDLKWREKMKKLAGDLILCKIENENLCKQLAEK